MPTVDLTGAEWRKSSFSGGSGENGACVEVAFTSPAVIVRDSKAAESGAIAFSTSAWRAFLSGAARRA